MRRAKEESSGRMRVWPYFKNVTCTTEYSCKMFRPKISCFLSCFFLWLLVSFSSVCLPMRLVELFKNTQKSRRYYFSGRFFTLSMLHYLRRSLSRAYNKALRS